MEQVLILLLMFAGATHAFFTPAATKCYATQNTSLCSATVGGSVYIQMMTNISIHQLHCKKQLPSGPIKVFNMKKGTMKIEEAFKKRTEFFISNVTFKINKVEKNDSGQYTVEVFDRNGVLVETINVKLEVQENYMLILILVSSAVALIVIVIVIVIVLRCCCCDNKKGGHKRPGESSPQSAVYT